jgi:NADH-quinone oxidoreductase subunit G
MVRKGGKLVEATWDEALQVIANKFKESSASVAGLASDRLSNEDLFTFRNLFAEGLKSKNYGLADQLLAGGDVVAQVGIAKDSNLLSLGKGDAILVVASDLHESAPVWWLRVKQAAERGATVVVLNGYETRLDAYAKHVVQYKQGKAINTVRQVVNSAKVTDASDNDDQLQQIGQALVNADNLVVFYGDAGLNYEQTDVVAKMLGNLLLLKPHAGKINNGIIPVHPRANTQGAWDMGVARTDAPDIYVRLGKSIKTLYVAGADPVGDGKMSGKNGLDFLIVQELFMTATAEVADVVLPAQSWAEREGTFTSGERRVQRYYPAIQPVGDSRADWQILAQIGEKMGMGKAKFAGSLVFKQISQGVKDYAGMDYRTLAQVVDQWPEVGGEDLYYGGTSYDNQAGIGEQWASGAELGSVDAFTVPSVKESANEVSPRAALYAPGTLILKSEVLVNRLAQTVNLEPVN